MRAPYIAVEGPDGSGKSTFAKALAQHLNGFLMCEPYNGTEVTSALRKFALDQSHKVEVNAEAREYLMLANRSISTKIVLEKIKSNIPVVSDRSMISGMVYANVAGGYDVEAWWDMAVHAFQVMPDFVVHLTPSKCNIDVVKGDIYDSETATFHKKIKEAFPKALIWFADEYDIESCDFDYRFDEPVEKQVRAFMKYLNKEFPEIFRDFRPSDL